jgi:hypothetical protein
MAGGMQLRILDLAVRTTRSVGRNVDHSPSVSLRTITSPFT